MNDRFRLTLLRLLPTHAISRLAGRFAGSRLSKWLIPIYARHFQIDLQQAEKPLEAYQTLTEFFTRKLKSECRPIAEGERVLVSPVDGVVSQSGPIRNGTLLQAKGVSYSLEQLLGDRQKAESYEGGVFLTIYLSPRDYHRIHTCLKGTVTGYSYIPGTLFPVNPFGVRNIPGLFAKNERLTTYIATPFGEYAIVKVGATIVGSVQVVYDEKLTTNVRHGRMTHATVAGPTLEKGAELGLFRFGSTVICLFQPGMVQLDDLQEGQFVQMGQRIGEIAPVQAADR
ncbi:archaetidylserine decarboxylase [Effusibacillus pohliae]|uniref:archaetidylserine decarboxylase n=1 Tax=Effusibacillus pohliae TaxID=232270 RepID=UPI00037819D6|nr:archaetidylserine decarboxylase [Effusibacillus pohliae]